MDSVTVVYIDGNGEREPLYNGNSMVNAVSIAEQLQYKFDYENGDVPPECNISSGIVVENRGRIIWREGKFA